MLSFFGASTVKLPFLCDFPVVKTQTNSLAKPNTDVPVFFIFHSTLRPLALPQIQFRLSIQECLGVGAVITHTKAYIPFCSTNSEKITCLCSRAQGEPAHSGRSSLFIYKIKMLCFTCAGGRWCRPLLVRLARGGFRTL